MNVISSDAGQRRGATGRDGFALVLTLTLLGMLLVLCLTLAPILAIQLRIGGASVTMARARMNAVAASRIALGELQRLAGADRRVTANAAILDAASGSGPSSVARPRLLGVWRGLTAGGGAPAVWSLSDLPAVSPVGLDYATDHDTAFTGWLCSGRVGGVSLTDARAAGRDWAKQTPAGAGEWTLVTGGKPAPGPLSPGETTARLTLTAPSESFSGDDTDAASGRFAWVVSDENQKARVDLRDGDRGESTLWSATERAALSAASARRFHPATAGDRTAAWPSALVRPHAGFPLDFRTLIADPEEKKWVPADDVLTGETSRALRHDFTTASVSLLTDVADGGLKRDINRAALLSDADFDALPGIGGATGYIGFETMSPNDPAGRSAWRRTRATQLIPFPKNTLGDGDGQLFPTWNDVRNWTTFASTAVTDKSGTPLLSLVGGRPTLSQINTADDIAYANQLKPGGAKAPGVDRQYHAPWRRPLLARYRMEFALHAEPDASKVTYRLLPQVNIVVQIWNPYDTDLRLDPKETFGTNADGLPFQLQITGRDAAGSPITRTMTLVAWYPSNYVGRQTSMSSSMRLDGTLRPGEVRTYSVPMTPVGSGDSVLLSPGYYPGHYMNFASTVTGHYPVEGFGRDYPLTTLRVLLRTNTDNYRPPYQCYFTRSGGPSARIGAAMNATRDGSDQNPVRLIGSGTISGAPSPFVLASQALRQPLLIFETRLKAEAFSGRNLRYATSEKAPGNPGEFDDSERFMFGEPVSVFTEQFMADGRRRTWVGSAYESLVWAKDGLDDTESTYPLEVTGSSGETGFAGTGLASTTGPENGRFVWYHAPLHPPVGLLSMRHARLGGALKPLLASDTVDRFPGMTAVRDAFGNALLNPYVPINAVYGANPIPQTTPVGAPPFRPYDMSWILNAAVADGWFSSSLGAWDKGAAATLFPGLARPAAKLYGDFMAGRAPLPDRRFAPDPLAPADARSVFTGDTTTPDASGALAASMIVEGGFNVNSVSVRAWRAFLAASHADTATSAFRTGIAVADEGGLRTEEKTADTAVVPVANVPVAEPTRTPALDREKRTNGGRVLSDADLDALAKAAVAEVKRRGPFLSLGEFLNRRIEPGEAGRLGAMQAAIEAAKLNAHLAVTGRRLHMPDGMLPAASADIDAVYSTSGVNRPGWFSQADLLAPLATAMTVRGDTFVIRVSASADGDPSCVATLELTVRRTYAYVTPSDTGGDATRTAFLALREPANRAFGRRFAVVATRWVSPESL